MRRINKQEYEMCVKKNLLFDGVHFPENLDKSVRNRAQYKNNVFGRNWIRTKNSYFITEGRNGISDSLDYFMKKDIINCDS